MDPSWGNTLGKYGWGNIFEDPNRGHLFRVAIGKPTMGIHNCDKCVRPVAEAIRGEFLQHPLCEPCFWTTTFSDKNNKEHV